MGSVATFHLIVGVVLVWRYFPGFNPCMVEISMKKINGCLPRAQDPPVLVIPPNLVKEDVSYWSRHALIYKFLGICIPLSTLEAWIHRSWQIEGDMDIMLATNSYFMVIFSNIEDCNRFFEGGPYFYN